MLAICTCHLARPKAALGQANTGNACKRHSEKYHTTFKPQESPAVDALSESSSL